MNRINRSDFQKVELRVGTIVAAESFPETRNPAYKLTVDFGADVGTMRLRVLCNPTCNSKEDTAP